MSEEQFQKEVESIFQNEAFQSYFQQKVKESIRNMFHSKEITINTYHKDEWEDRYIVTEVEIDGESIYENKEYIGESGWNDY